MIDNNGLMINMRVKDHIPYVSLDQVKEQGNVKKIKSLLDILNDDCSPNRLAKTKNCLIPIL